MNLRHEAVATYRYLRQFWPWHKRAKWAVRWSARHGIFRNPIRFVVSNGPHAMAVAKVGDTLILDRPYSAGTVAVNAKWDQAPVPPAEFKMHSYRGRDLRPKGSQ